MIKCKYCDKKYRYRGWYRRHLRKLHPDAKELLLEKLFLPGIRKEFLNTYKTMERLMK